MPEAIDRETQQDARLRPEPPMGLLQKDQEAE